MIKLNVEFLGMCLYVDDARDAAHRRMHVLLLAPDMEPEAIPRAGDGHCSHGTCATDHHHPRLFYDAVHDGGAKEPDRVYRSISLEDKVLDLSRFGGKLEPEIDAVPNLSDITGSRVAPRRLEDEPGDLVTARVTFAAGKGTPERFESQWKLHQSEDVGIAHKVRWTLEFGDDQLDAEGLFQWELGELNKRGGQLLVPLRPVGGEINLRVMNVLREELAPRDSKRENTEPADGFQMSHFKPLYAVLTDPKDAPVPMWVAKKEEGENEDDGNLPGGPIGDNFKCGTGRAVA